MNKPNGVKVSHIIFLLVVGNLAVLGYKLMKKSRDTTSLFFVERLIDLGEIHVEEFPSAVFKLKNTGDTDLIISNVKSDCHCTIPSWSNEPVKSGDWIEIIANYDNSNFGFFQQNISVFCNTNDSPILLTIQGRVIFEKDSIQFNIR